MRRRDDGADVGVAEPDERRDAGRRQHPDAHRDTARGRDAGGERVLEHEPRAARIAPDQDARLRRVRPRAAFAREPGGRPPETERELGRERRAVGDATDTVRAEQARQRY